MRSDLMPWTYWTCWTGWTGLALQAIEALIISNGDSGAAASYLFTQMASKPLSIYIYIYIYYELTSVSPLALVIKYAPNPCFTMWFASQYWRASRARGAQIPT